MGLGSIVPSRPPTALSLIASGLSRPGFIERAVPLLPGAARKVVSHGDDTLLNPWYLAEMRPFPAHRWLEQRYPFQVSRASLSRIARPLTPAERHTLESTLLLSRLPDALRPTLLAALQVQLARRHPWSAERALTLTQVLVAERRSDDARASGTLAGLRQALVTEFALGVATIEMPPEQLSRPQRNYWLARRAARIGRLADDLARHPAALPLARELQRTLAARRR